MYHGEVNVKQDHLNSFLAVAERLRVRGLCQNDGTRSASSTKPAGPSAMEKSKARVLELQRNPEPAAKRPRPSHPATPIARDQDDDDEVEELPPPQVKLEELAAEAAQGAGVRRGSHTQHFAAAAEAHGGHYPMAEAGYEESMQGGSEYGDYSGYEDEMGYMEAGGGQGGVDPTLASKGRRGGRGAGRELPPARLTIVCMPCRVVLTRLPRHRSSLFKCTMDRIRFRVLSTCKTF
jgi:hypothetical protein